MSQPKKSDLIETQPTAIPMSPEMALLRWVADKIVVRNANGKYSEKFCLLCPQARLKREPCRHAQIWEMTGRGR